LTFGRDTLGLSGLGIGGHVGDVERVVEFRGMRRGRVKGVGIHIDELVDRWVTPATVPLVNVFVFPKSKDNLLPIGRHARRRRPGNSLSLGSLGSQVSCPTPQSQQCTPSNDYSAAALPRGKVLSSWLCSPPLALCGGTMRGQTQPTRLGRVAAG
jgi:hypothetical protein